ncbi:MAG: PAS domain-containing protein [Candidatus Synoicihabitans palmerolidicus]|nr:PAS domain-containing protein [Candidatus Synoicihabitans palmerolidicus]
MTGLTPLHLILLSADEVLVSDLITELETIGYAASIETSSTPDRLSASDQRGKWQFALLDTEFLPANADSIAHVHHSCGRAIPIVFISGHEVTASECISVLDAGAVALVPRQAPSRIAVNIVRTLRLEFVHQQHENNMRLIAASDRRFATIFDASPIPTVMTEMETGQILEVNPTVEKLLGMSREQIIGRESSDFGVWRDHAQRRRFIADALFGGASHTMERQLHVHVPAGSTLTVLISFCRIELEGKNRLLIIMQDITTRKAAEDTLRENEERYRLLVENSHDLIWEIDPCGLMRYVSPNHTTVTGYLSDELDGQPVVNCIHPDEQAKATNILDTSDQRAELCLRFQHRKGHGLTLESSQQSYRIHDGSRRAVVISRDINPRPCRPTKTATCSSNNCDKPSKWKPPARWQEALLTTQQHPHRHLRLPATRPTRDPRRLSRAGGTRRRS